VDYTLSAGILTFAAEVVTQNISISIVDDSVKEDNETIIVTLSSPTNATLGTPGNHTYTILDDERGVFWNGLIWYYSDDPNPLFINGDDQLEWDPEKPEQFITRIPEQRLSQVGDMVEVVYWLLTDGAHDCPDCFSCDLYCLDDDITCIAGTSDFRFGLFEADGEYVETDGLGTNNSIFEGYMGYNWRFGPNMKSGPTCWVDCTGEVHKTGNFAKKPVGSSSLMTVNEGLEAYIPGFERPPGTWSLLTLRLERRSSSSVQMSITYNDRTYSWTDGSSSGQPSKIDVFGVHMRNGRPYNRLVLDNVCEGLGEADFNGDDVVDEKDLRVVAQDWLLTGASGPVPDANQLAVHYKFDETSGSTAYDSSVLTYNGQVQSVSTSSPKTTAWDPDGYEDGCINFDGNTKVVVPVAALAAVDAQVTVSLWVNGDPAVQPDQNWGMPFHGRASTNDRRLHTHIPTKYGNVMLESGSYQAQRIEWAGAGEQDWEGGWNHYAFVVDSTVEHKVKIYHNGGDPVAEGSASIGVGGIDSFHVGCGIFSDGTAYEYFGKIDDFRVYSYALSTDEITYIASEGQMPADSPANLYYDGVVDFKDYSTFALEWLGVCE